MFIGLKNLFRGKVTKRLGLLGEKKLLKASGRQSCHGGKRDNKGKLNFKIIKKLTKDPQLINQRSVMCFNCQKRGHIAKDFKAPISSNFKQECTVSVMNAGRRDIDCKIVLSRSIAPETLLEHMEQKGLSHKKL